MHFISGCAAVPLMKEDEMIRVPDEACLTLMALRSLTFDTRRRLLTTDVTSDSDPRLYAEIIKSSGHKMDLSTITNLSPIDPQYINKVRQKTPCYVLRRKTSKYGIRTVLAFKIELSETQT